MNGNGELTAPALNGTVTVGGTYQPSSTGTYHWPYTWPYNSYPSIYVTPPYYAAPVECAGDVHVFPCPHCEKCKCGQATVKRKKK